MAAGIHERMVAHLPEQRLNDLIRSGEIQHRWRKLASLSTPPKPTDVG
jgi:hypothetical protein